MAQSHTFEGIVLSPPASLLEVGIDEVSLVIDSTDHLLKHLSKHLNMMMTCTLLKPTPSSN